MRSKQGLLLLLLMALIFLCIHPLSAASLVEKMKKEDQERGRAIAQLKKISQGNGGGSPAASGGNGGMPGENGGSGSPKVQGGGGVTPVYAAGAGNNPPPAPRRRKPPQRDSRDGNIGLNHICKVYGMNSAKSCEFKNVRINKNSLSGSIVQHGINLYI